MPSTRFALATFLILCTLAGSAGAQCGAEYRGSDQPGDGFSSALAADDGWLAVGAEQDGSPSSGAVYLYESLGGDLVLRQILTPPIGGGSSDFGAALALEGSRLVVGAPGSGGRGRVFVYGLSGGSWNYEGEVGENIPSGAEFGTSVDVSGDRIIAGGPAAPTNRGRVWILREQAGVWVTETSLVAPPEWGPGRLGQAVAIDGTRAVVAAPFADSAPHFDVGRVFAYEYDGTQWNLTAELMTTDANHSDRLGQGGVDIEGETIVIGSPNASGFVGGGFTSRGYVYVFESQAGAWQQADKLTPADSHPGCFFGQGVRLENGQLLVGAHRQTSEHLLAGAAYLWQDSGGAWNELRRFHAPAPFVGDHLGHSVAFDGDRAFLGAGLESEVGWPQLAGRVWSLDLGGGDPALSVPFCWGDACACFQRSSLTGGCRNSISAGGELRTCGSGDVAADDVRLSALRLPPGQFGLVFMGGASNDLLFGEGRLCVGSGGQGLFRFPVRSTGSMGSFEETDLVTYSEQNFPGGAITPGSTWTFQVWYRDPGSIPCPANAGPGYIAPQAIPRGFNLTNALALTWRP